MKNYDRILEAFGSERWAMREESLKMVASIIAERIALGQAPDPDVIEARIARADPYGLSRAGVRTGSVARVELHGPMLNRAGMMQQMSGMTSPQEFADSVRAAADDDEVSEILLDIDSPGGTVSGTEEAANAVAYARTKKRVVALVGGAAASAAYWVASQASEIVAHRTSMVGSIGVLGGHADRSVQAGAQGVKVTYFRSGEKKAPGQPYESLTEEAAAAIQSEVDALAEVFYAAVAEGRGMTASEVRSRFGDGSVFVGERAAKLGLVDRIATIESVVESFTESGAQRATHQPSAGAKPNTNPTVMKTNESKELESKELEAQQAEASTSVAPGESVKELEARLASAQEREAEMQAKIDMLEEAAREDQAKAKADALAGDIRSAFSEGRINAAEMNRVASLAGTSPEAARAYLETASAKSPALERMDASLGGEDEGPKSAVERMHERVSQR